MEDRKDHSLLIFKTLQKHFCFEQARCEMYVAQDIYYEIPRLVFRLKEDDNEKYTEIKDCIERFNGNLKWTVYRSPYSRKGNHILGPNILFETELQLSQKQIPIKVEDFIPREVAKYTCERAIEDIPRLAEHIHTCFEGN